MYQSRIKGDRLYHALSDGYGQPVETFGVVQDGETPMSLLVIALGSCVTMCVQGYYKRYEGNEAVQTELEISYDEGHFDILIKIADQLTEEKCAVILDYANKFCRVKALLREDLTFTYHIEEMV
ncbi:OsmC family protein [Streptococcus loxodontisalivarius]|uniref:OsmC-like protein n=1 Tax=Streptococcus loxodontisalivarius TaxID=1349415 RepID=A0ABS2PTN0_9STRE|nr:OsmC family protein [Streptococcus loxodontisalivarius]MBM7643413.1 putative OsmC-like protein [Streptococcus loxodontisalivarius]